MFLRRLCTLMFSYVTSVCLRVPKIAFILAFLPALLLNFRRNLYIIRIVISF